MEAAQSEMRRGYVNGAPAVLVSGLVWLAAGGVWARAGIPSAFATLFFGGILIMPLAIVIARTVYRAPRPKAGQPLDRLGLESTFILFAGILISYALLHSAPQTVFPIMATIIGARYFVFLTIYAEPTYWLLGAIIASAGGCALLYQPILRLNIAAIVGCVEVVFAVVLFYRYHTKWSSGTRAAT